MTDNSELYQFLHKLGPDVCDEVLPKLTKGGVTTTAALFSKSLAELRGMGIIYGDACYLLSAKPPEKQDRSISATAISTTATKKTTPTTTTTTTTPTVATGSADLAPTKASPRNAQTTTSSPRKLEAAPILAPTQQTPAPTPTPTPAATSTPAPASTLTPTATSAPTSTPAPTAASAPTATPTPTAAAAPTATPAPIATPAPTATSVPTATPAPAPTATPTPTPTTPAELPKTESESTPRGLSETNPIPTATPTPKRPTELPKLVLSSSDNDNTRRKGSLDVTGTVKSARDKSTSSVKIDLGQVPKTARSKKEHKKQKRKEMERALSNPEGIVAVDERRRRKSLTNSSSEAAILVRTSSRSQIFGPLKRASSSAEVSVRGSGSGGSGVGSGNSGGSVIGGSVIGGSSVIKKGSHRRSLSSDSKSKSDENKIKRSEKTKNKKEKSKTNNRKSGVKEDMLKSLSAMSDSKKNRRLDWADPDPELLATLVVCQAQVRGFIARRYFKKFRVAHEIYATEKSYVAKLQLVIKLFIKPLEKAASDVTYDAILDKNKIYHIFYNIKTLCSEHEQFLALLKQRLYDREEFGRKNVSDLFTESMDKLLSQLYFPYVNNFNKAMAVLNKCKKKRPTFAEFIEKCESKSECQLQDLDSLLILPIQRAPRYALLLRDLLNKCTNADEQKRVKAALDRITERLNEVNEAKRDAENVAKVHNFMHSFVYDKHAHKDEELPYSSTRRFVTEGLFHKEDPKTHKDVKSIKLILFTDSLIVTNAGKKVALAKPSQHHKPSHNHPKKTPTERIAYKVHTVIPLRDIHLISLANANDAECKCIKFVTDKKERHYFARSSEDASKWVQTIALTSKEDQRTTRDIKKAKEKAMAVVDKSKLAALNIHISGGSSGSGGAAVLPVSPRVSSVGGDAGIPQGGLFGRRISANTFVLPTAAAAAPLSGSNNNITTTTTTTTSNNSNTTTNNKNNNNNSTSNNNNRVKSSANKSAQPQAEEDAFAYG
eukprot:TRINITY_DN3478_c1_g1_i2.p1 TRINITY_DN3478_c1_g1~~TRINITY_DN3478_c1_g1_i2.p1  ORF type:complete len:1001 (+),score=253.52 TRINITY_DN3478_c1_g1_i2:285-3287(+)